MKYGFYGWDRATITDTRGLAPRNYYDLLSGIWCADTCAPRMRKDWTPENRTLGQCSITAFLIQDIYGGKVYGVPLGDGNFHCFNDVDGCVFNLTSEQFGDTQLDYANCPEQDRSVHFAKAEKKERYEKLRDALIGVLSRTIVTERLILRPFSTSDAADVLEYLATPAVNCFACMTLSSLDAAKAEMEKRAKDEFYLAIVLKESGKVIGELFGHPEASDPEDKEMDTFSPCWMLNLNYTGKGHAYVAAHAYFDYLFREKDVRRIFAYTEDYNLPSQRLCEKLGMRREGLFMEFVSFINNPDGTPRYENTMRNRSIMHTWQ